MSQRLALRSSRSALILLGLALAQAADVQAQTGYTSSAVGIGTVHIRSISPRSGPAGTVVRIEADGLPIDTPVYVALGSLHGGYEVLGHNSRTDGNGNLVATVTIPEQHRGHSDHSIVVLLLKDSYTLMASSDPFHITDEAGLVKRTGVIEIAHPGCPLLRGWDGVAYALVGRQAASLIASVRHQAVIEGSVVEGSCGLQNALEVARATVSMPEP